MVRYKYLLYILSCSENRRALGEAARRFLVESSKQESAVFSGKSAPPTDLKIFAKNTKKHPPGGLPTGKTMG